MPMFRALDRLTAGHPVLVLASATAIVSGVAWAVGLLLSRIWVSPGPWLLGGLMLGWMAYLPNALKKGRDGPDDPQTLLRATGLRTLFVACAVVPVALLDGLNGHPVTTAMTLFAGVLLPTLASEALQRYSVSSPPRGVCGAELRLLITGVAIAPISAALRNLSSDLNWNGLAHYFDLLIIELLMATICVPLSASVARWLSERIGAIATRGDRAERASSAAGVSTALVVSTAIATVVCIGAAEFLQRGGHEDLAKVVAVLHLLVGLVAARSMYGITGAVVIAVNAFAMTGSLTSNAFAATMSAPREIGTSIQLAGVFALQAMLHSVSSDSREAAKALIRQALLSDLSGLPNQRALARIVGAMLARPKRGGFWLVGVVLPDIARWSDLTGSTTAAELERSVAGRLRATFEPLGARVAHPSSGRFVITLGDKVDGLGIRQRLRSTLGGQRFDTSEQSIQLRYHAGMVEVPASAEVGPEAVLTALSMSLQRAANDPVGIHRAVVSAELIDDYRTELKTIEVVSRALAEGRIQLFAERIEAVRPAPRELLTFEVLVRVEGDDGKLLQPKQFLPAVWHAGLHSKLDRLVFVRTISYLASNRLLHDATHLCSINVCGPTLCDPEFPDYVKRCLATHTVDPRRLMIEITESSAIADLELARAHVTRLSEMGLSIALDDFGTGLATFDYLKRLRADVLKIDGSFIRNIVDDPLDREIVATIVRIARTTGARTVAEWIETPKQREIAAELGVDYLQGYLIAKPAPIETLQLGKETGRAPKARLELGVTATFQQTEWTERRASPRPSARRDLARTTSR